MRCAGGEAGKGRGVRSGTWRNRKRRREARGEKSVNLSEGEKDDCVWRVIASLHHCGTASSVTRLFQIHRRLLAVLGFIDLEIKRRPLVRFQRFHRVKL